MVQKAWALCVFPTGTDPRRQNGLKESGACHGFEVGALWGRQTSGRAASVETGVASDDASFSSCAVVFLHSTSYLLFILLTFSHFPLK